MTELSLDSGREIASFLLEGTYLDSVLIYSSSVVLCFSRARSMEKPRDVWVSSTGDIKVLMPGSLSLTSRVEPTGRTLAIGLLSELIGQDVDSAQILDEGALSITLGPNQVQLAQEAVDAEEVWSITSDSPDPSYKHQWSVTLDDTGRVSVHTPRSAGAT